MTCGLAGLSRCRRLQVGCSVLTPDLSGVVAVGYNGPPASVDNDSCSGAEGACGCVHADANALVKLTSSDRGLVMLLTHSPCWHCAGLVLNCGGRVGHLVYGDEYRDAAGVNVLKRAGLTVTRAACLGLGRPTKKPTG